MSSKLFGLFYFDHQDPNKIDYLQNELLRITWFVCVDTPSNPRVQI